MSIPLDRGHHLELRDAAGQVIGVFLVDRAVEELRAECDRLRAEVLELQKTLKRTRQESKEQADQLAAREEKIAALISILNEYLGFTPAELADLDRNGITLSEIITQIEKSAPRTGDEG